MPCALQYWTAESVDPKTKQTVAVPPLHSGLYPTDSEDVGTNGGTVVAGLGTLARRNGEKKRRGERGGEGGRREMRR